MSNKKKCLYSFEPFIDSAHISTSPIKTTSNPTSIAREGNREYQRYTVKAEGYMLII